MEERDLIRQHIVALLEAGYGIVKKHAAIAVKNGTYVVLGGINEDLTEDLVEDRDEAVDLFLHHSGAEK